MKLDATTCELHSWLYSKLATDKKKILKYILHKNYRLTKDIFNQPITENNTKEAIKSWN